MTYNFTVSGQYLIINLEEELSVNSVYTVVIDSEISGVLGSGYYTMNDDYSFWFTSAYCPIFTTLTRVQLDAGPAASLFTDDTIYRMIHKNSIDIIDIYNAYHNTTFAYDYFGCTWDTAPIVFRRYVECKTAYDILALVELINSNNGSGAGGQLKTLGDLTIKYDGGSAAVISSAGNPNRKKQLYDCWLEMINAVKNVGGDAGLQSAVRGWYDVTKGFSHPVYDSNHNRVIRTVDFKRSDPRGPWESSEYWRANI